MGEIGKRKECQGRRNKLSRKTGRGGGGSRSEKGEELRCPDRSNNREKTSWVSIKYSGKRGIRGLGVEKGEITKRILVLDDIDWRRKDVHADTHMTRGENKTRFKRDKKISKRGVKRGDVGNLGRGGFNWDKQ